MDVAKGDNIYLRNYKFRRADTDLEGFASTFKVSKKSGGNNSHHNRQVIIAP